MTKTKQIYEFECVECGHVWETESTDQVSECPNCGVGLFRFLF